MSVNTRDAVLRALESSKIDFLVTVLGAAVDREAAVDCRFSQNENRQDQLRIFTRGLSIIYLFSFMQSHVNSAQWARIKVPTGQERSTLRGVNWDLFDIFKYVRDSFAHDSTGRVFPVEQRNTRQFLDLVSGRSLEADVGVSNERIVLGDRSVDQCFQVVHSVLAEATLRPGF